MTDEQKQLLWIDLCARSPYGVITDYKESEFEIPHWKITTIYPETLDGWIGYHKRVGTGSESGSKHFDIGEIKPYLRPMSSMTEEEINEYENFIANEKDDLIRFCNELIFYNAHHLDYRGLIEMGLALEAPKDMYKIE